MFTDITKCRELEHPPQAWRLGVAQVLPWLYLGGQEDVCQIIAQADLWIDFRHELPTNRVIYLPEHVAYHRIPFQDGNLEVFKEIFPQIKAMLDQVKQENKQAVLSCHAGVSRSALMALWYLADHVQDYTQALETIRNVRPYFEPHMKFQPLLKQLEQMFRKK
jgi:protein-tyrosine phosphatase